MCVTEIFIFFIFVLHAAYVKFSKWLNFSPQIAHKIVFFSIYIRPNLFAQLLLNKVQEQALFVMHFEHTHTRARTHAHRHTHAYKLTMSMLL